MPISVGDEAPNFDLTSTEDVVLMLRDEVPRSAAILYFFADGSDERTRRDLEALAAFVARGRYRVQVLGISPQKVAALKDVQRGLSLPFPLLSDDRGFATYYGVASAVDDEAPEPALFLVDRLQRVGWLANPVADVGEALPGLEKVLATFPSQAANYPRSIVNRVVDFWVN